MVRYIYSITSVRPYIHGDHDFLGFDLHQPALHLYTCTALALQYARIPVGPHSPPRPEFLCPLKKTAGVGLVKLLMKTLPDSMRLAVFLACSMSLLKMLAPRPTSVELARAMTSSSSDQGWQGTMGPKGSSWMMRELFGGLSMMVGVYREVSMEFSF